MKMKFKYYIGVALAAVTMVGCSEEFLESEPTEFVSSTQLAEYSEDNPALQAGNVSGIYALMYEPETGGTDGHDDYGQKGFDVYSDMLSSDMVLGGLTYGWYSGIARMTATIDNTDNRNYIPWRYYYRIIFSANNVIGSLGGNDAVPETEEGRIYMGQAKAMRGYAYFYLAQFYSEGYNPSTPILPIYTDTQSDAQPLSPTSDVYDLIVSDLTDAVDLLDGWNRSGKEQVNKYVAEGLLAYTYAAMGDYASVLPLTEDIINNGGFVLTNAEQALGGFNTVTSPGWMWGMDLTENQGLDLVSWWGQMDIFTYSYAYVGDPKAMDLGLYNAIPDGDVRKDQFEAVEGFGANMPLPINKFYPEERKLGGQRYISTDYIYMRVAEFYLLHAEAAAKTGDEATAQQYLAMLLDERVDDSSYVNGLSGQALEKEIYFQTRIELWGEGKSYLAMKRNEATITRGSNHLLLAGESFNYNDERLSFEIPNSEIQNNPNID
jgi:hypothetical protein